MLSAVKENASTLVGQPVSNQRCQQSLAGAKVRQRAMEVAKPRIVMQKRSKLERGVCASTHLYLVVPYYDV